MPLSSVIGSSSIMQPGVCTSTTRPASPYDGQVIYETDTDSAMVWNGTGWVVLSTGRANPGGLDLIKVQTIGTAVTSVTVSNVFSSTYDNYRVVFGGMNCSANDQVGLLTFGSTTTGYYGTFTYDRYDTTGSVLKRNNSSSIYAGISDTTSASNFSFDVFSPNLTKRTTVTGAGFGYANSFWFSGMVADTTQYTAFTLTGGGSSTMTGGTIAVYGYAK